MAGCGFGRCISERKAIRRQLLSWSRDASVLLGLEQVLFRIMEENSALKIRSDLYPMSSLVAYEMTSNNCNRDQNMGSELPFDLRTHSHSHPDYCAKNDSEPTKSNIHEKAASSSSPNGDLRHSPICESNETNQRTAEIQPFNLVAKCSGQPSSHSNCVIPVSSRETCLVFQERERPIKEVGMSSPADLIDPGGERSSPIIDKDIECEDEDDERIDVVTPDEVPVSKSGSSVISSLSQPYHKPFMAPPEYLLPRNHDSAISVPLQVQDSLLQSRNGPPVVPFQPLEVLARRLHQSFESYDSSRELPESSTGTLTSTAATLDLSTSSRSSSCSDHFNPSAQTPKLPLSPNPSPTPFNPFGVLPNFARLQEMNPMFREGLESALKPTYNPSLYSTNLPPHLLPWLLSSQIQNLVQCQTRTEGSRSIFGPYNGSIFAEEKDQQPLDLSAKKIPLTPLSDEDLVARVLEIKPSTRGRRRADNNKRTYTEDELHAALRDIQSGKLGTRRAAVIYGIPRSTLRNKVYKLQMERDRNKKLMEQNEKAATILPDSTHSGLLSFLSESKTQQGAASCAAFKSIIRSKMTEKLDELSKTKQAFLTGTERQRLLDSSFSYLFENIPKLALNLEQKSTPSEVLSSLSLYPQLNEFTLKIVEERFNEEIKRTKNRINGSFMPNYANSYKRESSDDPELSVPSYPVFMSSSSQIDLIGEEGKSILGSSRMSISPPQENLKDMIANMINQKMFNEESNLKRPASNMESSETFLPISVQRLETSVIKSSQMLPPDERLSQDQSKKRAKSPSTNSGGKGSRPKRGKYRNYDRDNLLKAVQAVQSGEMSVHRAGSFYGVPHSTLEYKVKERHLHKNRPKKEANVQSNVQSLLRNNKDSTTTNGGTLMSNSLAKDQYKTEIPDTTTMDISLTESRSNDDISIISVQPLPKKFKHSSEKEDRPYSSSLSIPPNPFLSNPFPFWNNASPLLAPFLSNHYQSENLYTSQMMMELQEKLGNKADLAMNSSPDRMDSKFPETFSRENQQSTKSHHELSNGGSITPSPPSSPTLNEGLLNSLLRKKIETASSESARHWQIPSVSAEHSQDGTKDNVSEAHSNQRLSPTQGPPTDFITLNALLPSLLAARSSFAAAAVLRAENTSEQSPPQPAPLSLTKGVTHIPFVGSHLTEAP